MCGRVGQIPSRPRVVQEADQIPFDLFTEDTDELKKVVSDLTRWKCCTRCILRFLGESQALVFQKPVKILNEWLMHHLESGGCDDLIKVAESLQSAKQVCTACLGILQEPFNSAVFHDQIEVAVRKEDYEYSSFTVALSTPVTILLRESRHQQDLNCTIKTKIGVFQHSLFITLRENHKSVFFGRGKECITQIHVIWKLTNMEELAKRFNCTAVHAKADSPFEITVAFSHEAVQKECNFLFELFPSTFMKRKFNRHGLEVFARMTVFKALGDVSDVRFKKYYESPPRSCEAPCSVQSISCAHDSIFLAGRYRKYSRSLPQTPWVINGERKAASSIEEQICDRLCQHLKTKEFKLAAAGREDVDVRMLGSGRPFCVEFVNPRRVNLTRAVTRQLQQDINSKTKDIEISDLQLVDRDATNIMKAGETEKVKRYSALCWTERAVTQDELDRLLTRSEELVLNQKTPIRVLHRRPLATRPRSVYSMRAELVDEHHLKLHLATQAGTYIKEFVHGDFGRTQPNLGSLLDTTCDILELDVEAVELDWPPPVDET